MKVYQENGSVKIEGNVTSIDDYVNIKNVFQELADRGVKEIDIFFLDSVSITSSVIGFMLKLVNVDKIRLNVITGDKKLLNLLDELELREVFRARMP